MLEVRQELADGRQQLREQHDRGLEGARVCARYTSLVDAAIMRLYDAYLAELPPSGCRSSCASAWRWWPMAATAAGSRRRFPTST